MRVITGSARGRRLKTPQGNAVRPTADSVKEAVFNIISSDIEGRRVLDLFAGTGQLGIEALSRGASHAVFTDSSRDSVRLIRENISTCGFEGVSEVHLTDAVSFLSSCGKFDVVFIDPPYDSGLYGEVYRNINLFDILTEGGIIITESRREYTLPEFTFPYVLYREYNYGRVKITVYTRKSEK